MRIHPRMMIVQSAEFEISGLIDKVAMERDLTNVELLMILSNIPQRYLKFQLRQERHPENPDSPADAWTDEDEKKELKKILKKKASK